MKGKTILVTGDSRGLGASIRFSLESSGYKIVGLSRESSEINFDLSQPHLIKNLYLEKIKPLGPIYGFVSNAAIAYDDIISNMDLDKLTTMYNINVLSPLMLTKYIIRDMILNRTTGSIVHISSISVHTGYKGLSMYASSKAAVEAFSKNTAREWGKLGIRSNVVCPGFMDTEMSQSLNDSQRKKIFTRNSKQKELATSEVAQTVEFLIGDNSSGITGQTIHVDNGTI